MKYYYVMEDNHQSKIHRFLFLIYKNFSNVKAFVEISIYESLAMNLYMCQKSEIG